MTAFVEGFARGCCSQTRPHQRVSIRGRSEPRHSCHSVAGQGLFPASQSRCPMRNPTTRPESLTLSCYWSRGLAGASATASRRRDSPRKPCIYRVVAHGEQFRPTAREISRNFLPGAQEAQGAICAEHEIPQFSPARLLIQVGEDQVLGLQGAKARASGKQNRRCRRRR